MLPSLPKGTVPIASPGEIPSASPSQPSILPTGCCDLDESWSPAVLPGGEKRREGREAEAGEKRPSLVTPPGAVWDQAWMAGGTPAALTAPKEAAGGRQCHGVLAPISRRSCVPS